MIAIGKQPVITMVNFVMKYINSLTLRDARGCDPRVWKVRVETRDCNQLESYILIVYYFNLIVFNYLLRQNKRKGISVGTYLDFCALFLCLFLQYLFSYAYFYDIHRMSCYYWDASVCGNELIRTFLNYELFNSKH